MIRFYWQPWMLRYFHWQPWDLDHLRPAELLAAREDIKANAPGLV